MSNIKQFSQISIGDASSVGGKGASLGEMVQLGIPIPQGFVIIVGSLTQLSEHAILEAFDVIDAKRVAVRSSAVGEDSSQVSWAGQLETYLNVGRENIIKKIKECLNSIKSERALVYAKEQKIEKDQLRVAVVIQKMVDSQVSGVLFTVNPVTGEEEIMVEAGYGLGEMIVQGSITPDNYIIDKRNLNIKSKDIQVQETMLVFQDGVNKEIPVTEDKKGEQKISDINLTKLGELALKIEKHYGAPQDIEWAVDQDDKIWILQARPITTLK